MLPEEKLQKELVRPLVEVCHREITESEEYAKTQKENWTKKEKRRFLILDIYRHVRSTKFGIDLYDLGGDMQAMMNRVIELSRRVVSYEQEIYRLAILEELNTEDLMGAFYGTVPTDSLYIFEVIEEVVDGKGADKNE